MRKILLSLLLTLSLASPAFAGGWAEVRFTNQRTQVRATQYLVSNQLVAWSVGVFGQLEPSLTLFTALTSDEPIRAAGGITSYLQVFYGEQYYGIDVNLDHTGRFEVGLRIGALW